MNTHTACKALPFKPRRAHARIAGLAACVLLALAAVAAPAQAQTVATGVPQKDLPRTQLRAGKARMEVQLASTFHQRQVGLMHRTDMPANEGMLFVFPQTAMQCFWMKNTPLPLTAAFVAADGTIVNLADMQPFSEQNHCSAKPVAYVLEMHQGWFKRHGVRPGMRLKDVQGQLFQQTH